MSTWAQWERFKTATKAYQERTGKNQAAVADDLEVSLPTLRNYLYGSKVPGAKTLQRAAALYGCSVTEFMDDPGAAPIEGIKGEDWYDASERDRVIAAAVFSDIKGTDLTDEEKDELYKEWKMSVMRYLRMKEMASKQTPGG